MEALAHDDNFGARNLVLFHKLPENFFGAAVGICVSDIPIAMLIYSSNKET